MPTIQLYDKLLQFQLFQGMSRSDLMQIVARTKFDFVKLPAGKRVVREGDRCDRIFFLINGCLKFETQADDHSYTFVEEMQAPGIIQPECLFGITQRFRSTVHTLTDVNFITIDKKETATLSDTFLVFRINLLNIFATQTQKLLRRPWTRCPQDLRIRITRFFIDHCQHPAGPKTIHIYMERLAAEVNDSRLDVSRALNAMQADGLISLGRGRIEIPALELLSGGVTANDLRRAGSNNADDGRK